MKYLFLLASIIVFTSPFLALAKDGTVSASEGWNNSAGFQTSYDKAVKLTTAEAIERQNGGYYDQWQQNNSYITNTAIGAQTTVEAPALTSMTVTNSQCGHSIGQAPVDADGGNSVTTGNVRCAEGSANE